MPYLSIGPPSLPEGLEDPPGAGLTPRFPQNPLAETLTLAENNPFCLDLRKLKLNFCLPTPPPARCWPCFGPQAKPITNSSPPVTFISPPNLRV